MGRILALAAGTCALAARNLYAVRHIHDDRIAEVTHDGKAPHVRYQRVVAKTGPALSQHDLFGSRPDELIDDIFHVPRSQELALLDVHHAACMGSCHEQVRLAAEKSRDLDDIEDFRCFST